ncbi:MAG TPA: DUF411 domain-containing protein [Gemmatimonadales bacterium]|jgi:hypothetical protein|nr:DUF411 domain-containing protein [Gemmatimonadales bacterium]
MMSRRDFVAQTTGLALGAFGARAAWGHPLGAPGTAITVYKSASCGCCTKWVDHLRASGFTPTVHDDENVDAIKDEMGVPKDLRSCHTAMLGRYLVEGHVPAADLRRLLAERPAVLGLAVPGMPKSAPGMAVPGETPEPYQVVAFAAGGKTSVFAKH